MRRISISGPWALLPIVLFLALFIGAGVYFTALNVEYAFYKISATVAILPAIALAIILGRYSIIHNVQIFLEGVREKNIITMCMIYLLAGAYTEVLKGIGGVDATVQLALELIPQEAILPGFFIMAAFISTALGTSMGTIAALAPIAVGLAESCGISQSLMAGVVIGGSMFGDNLSMISDTTIAATQIHPCSLKDKFKINGVIAVAPVILTLLILSFYGFDLSGEVAPPIADTSWITSVPYFLVLGLALGGLNVFVVLSIGLMASAFIGLIFIPSYTFTLLAQNIFQGYTSMNEILILSLLIGGLSELAKSQGGIAFLIRGTDKFVKRFAKRKEGSKVAEAAISLSASFCDICTANNTIAIILSGETTQELSKRYKIPNARTAALVDLFSCAFQGILPYSAQVLLAGSLARVSPLSIIPYIHYCFLLGLFGILAILWKFPKFKLDQTI